MSVQFLIIGAGAAGLMAARELTKSGASVKVLEARNRIGGRILPLPQEEFGYTAEGGAEFIHGRSPITRALVREAGLTEIGTKGESWRFSGGRLLRASWSTPFEDEFIAKLTKLDHELPVADYLDREFGGPRYAEMRRSILRMVEGYDAADPARASSLALRDLWLGEGDAQSRILEGYGALMAHLARGIDIRFEQEVRELSFDGLRISVVCTDHSTHAADAAIVTIPPPALADIRIALPPLALQALANLAFGDVMKLLFRFREPFWSAQKSMSFLFSELAVPTWWTQSPATHPVLTGWLAGPRLARLPAPQLNDPVALGSAVLAEIFGKTPNWIESQIIAARGLHWGTDPFSRCAYSYASIDTKEAQRILGEPIWGHLLFAGEAFYQDGEVGTVEAALSNGAEAARKLLSLMPR